jgi:hypothetical protein
MPKESAEGPALDLFLLQSNQISTFGTPLPDDRHRMVQGSGAAQKALDECSSAMLRYWSRSERAKNCPAWKEKGHEPVESHAAYALLVCSDRLERLAGGWLMRNTDRHGNWGFLLNAIVVAITASLVTWFFRRVVQHQTWSTNHPQHHAHSRA